jgi:undecaprenyl-phosphate galactose phosphotransferase/putative colanic acid biosynthesis UDP-glucose lipid carrier transferase
MSGVRAEVPTPSIWPKAVPDLQEHNNASGVAERQHEIGSLRSVARSANTAAHVPIISNEQASSGLSLLLTAIGIVVTGAVAGAMYQFIVGRNYHDLAFFVATGVLIAVIFCGALRLSEERQPMKLSHAYGRARDAFVAWMITFAVFLAIAFTLKLGDDLSRGAIISTFLLGLIAVPLSHMHSPLLLARMRKSGAFMRRDVIVIGAKGNPSLAKLLQDLVRSGYSTTHVVEFNAACSNLEWPNERKTLLDQVLSLTHRLGPAEICFALSHVPHSRVETILRSLAFVPRAILAVPDEVTGEFLRNGLTEIGNRVALDVQKAPMTGLRRAIKRSMDIVLSAVLILFFSPLLLAISVAVMCDSSGPILFRQRRHGYQGRPFRIFKFRTMTVMEDGDVPNQVSKNDRRVTRIGKILRKYSLDELPQLFNVLAGEMSLIGPRPHPLALDAFYAKLIDNYEIRQHVKPGITGWAQVHGLRGETQTLDLMYRRIEFDCWYAKNCNLLLDLRILLLTVLEVLRPRNAY